MTLQNSLIIDNHQTTANPMHFRVDHTIRLIHLLILRYGSARFANDLFREQFLLRKATMRMKRTKYD